MFDVAKYWNDRYKSGGDSGAGSYGLLAIFKAEIINDFVEKNNINTVLEFGCGDGNQLTLANYHIYKGIDISEAAINICKNTFQNDLSKVFLTEHDGTKAELVLSLDVLFHIIDEKELHEYIFNLFRYATKYVIIYACDEIPNYDCPKHFKPKPFTNWINKNIMGWKLKDFIKNKYPYNAENPTGTSVSNFYIYERW
jgi:SAM-dependent methyltransferase